MTKLDYESLNDRLCEALGKCADGDKTAFRTVYELTAPKLLSLLTHQLKDAEAARDVLQKAYVSIWTNAGKFDPAKGKAVTWMLVIMRNRGLDHLRKCARTPETAEIEHGGVHHLLQLRMINLRHCADLLSRLCAASSINARRRRTFTSSGRILPERASITPSPAPRRLPSAVRAPLRQSRRQAAARPWQNRYSSTGTAPVA